MENINASQIYDRIRMLPNFDQMSQENFNTFFIQIESNQDNSED